MLYFPIIEHLVFVKCMMTLSNRKSASLSVPGHELTCATIFILKRYLKVQTKKVPAKRSKSTGKMLEIHICHQIYV